MEGRHTGMGAGGSGGNRSRKTRVVPADTKQLLTSALLWWTVGGATGRGTAAEAAAAPTSWVPDVGIDTVADAKELACSATKHKARRQGGSVKADAGQPRSWQTSSRPVARRRADAQADPAPIKACGAAGLAGAASQLQKRPTEVRRHSRVARDFLAVGWRHGGGHVGGGHGLQQQGRGKQGGEAGRGPASKGGRLQLAG